MLAIFKLRSEYCGCHYGPSILTPNSNSTLSTVLEGKHLPDKVDLFLKPVPFISRRMMSQLRNKEILHGEGLP